MPGRSRRGALAERAAARLSEQHYHCREVAQRGAQTRRQRREAQEAEAHPEGGAASPTRGHVARRSRPRVHADLLTVAIRGPLAGKMQAMADRHGMSLAKLLQDATLVYEHLVETGHEPGTRLAAWAPSQLEREA